MICSVDGCGRPHHSRGLCGMHYMRAKRGHPPSGNPTPRRTPLEVRFWQKVEKTDTCWLWTGATCRGYGTVWDGDRTVKAHRASWEMANGPIPDGLQLDHLCCTRLCVRPDHLEPVTQRENIARGPWGEMWRKRMEQTHCVNGHEFTPENTRWNGVRRWCIECCNIHNEEMRQRRLHERARESA